MALAPSKVASNPRIQKLIELEVAGRIKPEHQQELDTYRAQGLAPKGSDGGSESERTAGFLSTRLVGSLGQMTKATTADPSVASPEILPTVAGVFGDTARNYATSSGRQQVEAAQMEILDSALTLGTGAAYSKEQLESYRKSYFPQLGDGDATIADKKARLKTLVEAAKLKSGASAANIDRAIAAALAEPGEKPNGPPPVAGLGANDASGGSATPPGPGGGSKDDIDRAALEKKFNAGFGGAGANSDEYRAAYKARFGVEPEFVVDVVGGKSPDSEQLKEDRSGVLGKVDAAVRGAADTLTFGFADELAAAGDTIFGSGTMRQNLERQRNIDRSDERNNFGARLSGQIAGGVALPGFGVSSTRGLAALGGGYGAAYGFGSGEGGLIDRGKSAALGGAVGAAGGALGGTLADYITRRSGAARMPPGGADAVALARAGEEEGVALSRPIIDPSTRDRMSFLEASPGSGGPVRAALNATRESLEGRAVALGNGGVAQEGGALGQRIQDAGQRFVDRSRNVRDRLYGRAAQMAGDAQVTPTEAIAALDDHIATLSRNENSNRPVLNYLSEIRADLASGAKTVADMRDIRTNLRGNISQRNLMHTPAERIVGQVMDAARTDIQRDLADQAPGAVRAYQRADQFNGQRSDEIRQVVQRVIGRQDDRLSGEQVMTRLRAMAGPNGDSARLQRMVDKLAPDEQADYAATIAEKLGRKSPEEEFSPAIFIQSARGLSPEARRTIFGADGARSIANLRNLAEAYRATADRLNNTRSGQVVNWGKFLGNFATGGTIGSLIGGLPGGVAGAALGAGLSAGEAGLRNLSARALMSPDMSRWLNAAAGQQTPSAIARHISRLTQVAARDPAVASEAFGLQRVLTAMNDNVPISRAAASSGDREQRQP